MNVIVHHTGGTEANPLADTSHHTFEMVDRYHRSLWNFKSRLGHYIGYHFFLDKNGKITQGREVGEEGAHTRGYNKNVGICLAGNFDLTEPTLAQRQSFSYLLRELHEKHNILLVYPHRRFAAKTCYGTNLPNNWAQNFLNEYLSQKWRLHRSMVDSLINFIKAFT